MIIGLSVILKCFIKLKIKSFIIWRIISSLALFYITWVHWGLWKWFSLYFLLVLKFIWLSLKKNHLQNLWANHIKIITTFNSILICQFWFFIFFLILVWSLEIIHSLKIYYYRLLYLQIIMLNRMFKERNFRMSILWFKNFIE